MLQKKTTICFGLRKMFQQRAFAESLRVEVRAFTIDIHFINTIGRLPQPVKQGRQSCITIEALLLRPASIHLFTFQYIPIHLFINIFQTIHEQQSVKPRHLIGDSQQCDSNPPIPNCQNSIWRHFSCIPPIYIQARSKNRSEPECENYQQSTLSST